MTYQPIEVEADSLEEARQRVRSQLRDDSTVLQEDVLADGKPQTIEAITDSVPDAYPLTRLWSAGME